MSPEAIAKVCHEANRAYCSTIGDSSQVSWDDAPKWQQDSAIQGVVFCINCPEAPPSANHDAWLAAKVSDGWQYGLVKDPEKKQHPCCVPYDQLPKEQQKKDSLFKAIVGVLGHD